MRYFFPAKGDSLKAKEAWINAIGIKLVGAGIDSAVTSKNRDQTYSAVAELSMAEMLVGGSVATWGAAGAEVGISFPIQDYKKLNGVPDVGLKNGTKIVTFDQYSKAEK